APDAAPANKAAGVPDNEITRQILTAMIREDFGNTYATKLFKIVTVNGHVTLQGKVKNQKQKDAFGKAAESVVGPGNVDNQLEVKKEAGGRVTACAPRPWIRAHHFQSAAGRGLPALPSPEDVRRWKQEELTGEFARGKELPIVNV